MQVLDQIAMNQFGDILRVGELGINGTMITWKSTSLSKEQQLDNYKRAVREGLHNPNGIICRKTSAPINILAEEKEILWFWIMKATSINFALFEVMMALHAILPSNDPCQVVTVETSHWKSGKNLMNYSFDTFHDGVQIRMAWDKPADKTTFFWSTRSRLQENTTDSCLRSPRRFLCR